MADNAELLSKDQDLLRMYGPHVLRVLGVNDGALIEVNQDWHMGGAETYVSDFHLINGDQRTHLIAKACVKFAALETMNEWLERRRVLSQNGVLFPKLVVVDGATIVEEYIEFSFREAYIVASDDSVRDSLRTRYLDTFKRIVGAGFTPMSLTDVRSRGDDVVAIDVGEDIGGRSEISSCRLDVVSQAEAQFRKLI